jgi:protein phosphatase
MRQSLILGSATHVGLVRANNQDSHAILTGTPYPCALILADGMGGHRRGELASRIAVDYVRERLEQVLAEHPSGADLKMLLAAIMEKANVKVYLGSLSEQDSQGMGTTLTVAVLQPGQLLLAHAGDCRAYLLRDGSLSQLTVDHTLVQELVDAGTLNEDESRSHPRRHVLTRALGLPEYLQADVTAWPLEPGDKLLLCSDGLHGLVAAAEICSQMQHDLSADVLADNLVRLALAAGGDDNVTVLTAYVG